MLEPPTSENLWLVGKRRQFLAAACLPLPPPWSCLAGGLKSLFPLLFPPLFPLIFWHLTPFQSPLDKNTSALPCNFVIPWMIPGILSLHRFLASFSRWSLYYYHTSCLLSWAVPLFSLAASRLGVLAFSWGLTNFPTIKIFTKFFSFPSDFAVSSGILSEWP